MEFLSAPEIHLKPQKGFTLVELVVTITLIVLMAGSAIPSFNSYLNNQALKQAQEQIKSDIRTVQNKAITSAAADFKIGGTTTPTYWGVRFNNHSTDYLYFIARNNTPAECNLITTSDATGRYQGKGTLPSSMYVYSNTFCLFFAIKDGAVSTTTTSTTTSISHMNFGYTSTATCRSIYWTSVGAVYNTNSASCI
jgi:prepilin-type N-terminal cleavage/methylation domain-containing protein